MHGEIYQYTITVEDFKLLLSEMDESPKQKNSKYVAELNNTIKQLDIIDIYRALQETIFPLPQALISPGFPGGSVVKKPLNSTRDTSSIPGSGRSLGERNGNPLLYSCLGNPMDRGAWRTTVHGGGDNHFY